MNYRHAFHAGNFADLVKHAALACLLERLTADPSPLTVVDTHAGAGLYDLADEAQQRSREAEAGVQRLVTCALPPQFAGLAAAIARRNPGGGVQVYPGSPSLILDAMRPQDRYVACELRPDDHARLTRVLAAAGRSAEARQADGYATATAVARATPGRLLLLIDPPFEAADDYRRIVQTLDAVLKVKPGALALVWLPLKDLETLDGFVRDLERIDPPDTLIVEARLRPLHNPMKMNGCVLALVGAVRDDVAQFRAVAEFVVTTLGEPSGKTKLWAVGGAGSVAS